MNRTNTILIIIMLLLFVVVIGGVGIYFFMLKKDTLDIPTEKISKIKTPSLREIEKGTINETISQIGSLYSLKPFTLNLLSDGSEDVYLKVKLDFELSIKELENELDSKNAVIRDIVIKILTTKSVEDLSTDRGKEEAIDEIINKLNHILNDGYIKNIYFTEFIVQ